MKVYVELALAEADESRLRSLANGDQIWFARPEAITVEDAKALKDAEVVFGNPSRDCILEQKKLRWVQFPSVGVDYYRNIDWSAFNGRVTCTNLSGAFAEPCAETALAGLLALYRGLDHLIPLQCKRHWDKLNVRQGLKILRGARVLVLGTGSIGCRFQELLRPFDCEITTYSRTSGDLTLLAQLDDALPGADVVAAMLPATPETNGLLCAERLAKFKKGAIFVNVGRGSVVDEAALIKALQNEDLGGAVLDVTVEEPLPVSNALWSCPNTILTQHSGGGSSLENGVVIDVFEQNLTRFRKGLPLLNIVDWSRGY